MGISASALRSDIYNVLDSVLETGKPVTIVRNGQKLKIVAVIGEHEKPKTERLIERDCITGDPEDLAAMDWSDEWQPTAP